MDTFQIIYLIGVSGVGKSTIGKALSEAMRIPFFDGDDYHPEKNIVKMSNGQALNDEDRLGWLQTINQLAQEQLQKGSCIIACSALKESYRGILSRAISGHTKWVFLHGSFEQIMDRINHREAHFMKSDLLRSQFETLEEPERAINIDVSLTPEAIVDQIKKALSDKTEFGLYGLGVMGKSLSRNLASRGIHLSLYNRHVPGIEENVAINFKHEFSELGSARAFDDIEAFVNSLQAPRKIMLMVNAGKITDSVIEDLLPHLSEGDILIDGGNSNFNDTKVRFNFLKSQNIHFIGAGVSGGEEGALKGPSIMPGGDASAYKAVQGHLEAIAARDENDLPCCTYIGAEGSGHFVKMVHNGIEYAEMQLLAEVYTIFKQKGKNPDETAAVLESWKSSANSYLLDITVDILRKREGDDWLVDKILDKAGNKGTGNWAAITSAQYGVPSTMISEALNARYISFFKEDRTLASSHFAAKSDAIMQLADDQILAAYQFSRIINHYQGFRLISEVSKANNWDINLSELARIWTQGCIIKSDLMKEFVSIFKESHHILTNEKMIRELEARRSAAKAVVAECFLHDIVIPCLSDAFNFFNSYITAHSPANLIQAQRDCFGAHTYQRNDDDSGKFHHSNWQSDL